MSPAFRLRILLLMILLGLWVAPNLSVWWWTGGLFLGVFLYSFQKKALVLSFLLASLAGLFGVWQPAQKQNQDELETYQHESRVFTGTIARWPEMKTNRQQALIDVNLVDGKPVAGRMLLAGPKKTRWQYGQNVTATGTLRPPQNFDDFDYESYLARFHTYSVLRHPKSVQLGDNHSRWRPAILTRQWFEQNLTKHLPTPNNLLAAGVLIGVKSDLPEPTRAYFKTSGLQHLIVVSGSNVVLLITFIGFLCRRFGPILNTITSLLTLGVFVFITGADPPVVRASLFGLVVVSAVNLGRRVDIRNLLLLAAVLMGLYNPLVIQGDVSFWLSFSATAGIILGFPVYHQLTASWSRWPWLKLLFGVSLVAQLAVMPVLIMHFGTFPWIGIVSNLLAEPLVPITMGSGLVAGLSGDLPDFFSKVLSIPALVSTGWLQLLAHTFGQVPSLVLPPVLGKALALIWSVGAFWALGSRSYEQNFWRPGLQSLDAKGPITDYGRRT